MQIDSFNLDANHGHFLLSLAHLYEDPSLEVEMRLDDVLKPLGRVAQLSEHRVLEVVLEHVLRILVRLCVSRGGAVHALESGLVVVGLGAQDQRLNGDQDLENGQYVLYRDAGVSSDIFITAPAYEDFCY